MKNRNKAHRKDVYLKNNFCCNWCERKFTPPEDWNGLDALHDGEMFLEVDHVNPLSRGGEDIIENKQSLCKKCNLLKSDNLQYEWEIIILSKRNFFYVKTLTFLNRAKLYRNRNSKEFEHSSIIKLNKHLKEYKYYQFLTCKLIDL